MISREQLSIGLKLLFALEVAAIIVASLISPPALPDVGVEWGDKVGHLLAYAVAAGTGVLAFSRRGAVAVGLITLGVALEFAQGLGSAGRNADVYDALANTTGVAVALAGEWAYRAARSTRL